MILIAILADMCLSLQLKISDIKFSTPPPIKIRTVANYWYLGPDSNRHSRKAEGF